jgi:hypothetical protein
MFAEQLAYLGWSPDDLRRMLADNPRDFVGLPRPAPALQQVRQQQAPMRTPEES